MEIQALLLLWGRDSVVGINDSLQAGRSGDRIPAGATFSTPFQTVLGPMQPPIQWLSGLPRRYRGGGVALTTHPHLAPRLKEE